MIDDLYDDRLAAIDFVFLTVGLCVLVGTDVIRFPTMASIAAGLAVTAGATVFFVNMVLVIRRHSPQTLPDILFGQSADDTK
ncbi:MAG: hypothetical protein ACQET5_16695 [Halobacteriota archaeon]